MILSLRFFFVSFDFAGFGFELVSFGFWVVVIYYLWFVLKTGVWEQHVRQLGDEEYSPVHLEFLRVIVPADV